MKKSTDKAATTTTLTKKAPAKTVKKTAAPAAKSVVKAPVGKAPAVKAPAVKVSAVKAPAVTAPDVKAPAVKAPVVKAPAIKTAAAKLPATEITALIDVGYGNTLYLRGEGAGGLSWDTGLALDCIGDGKWSVSFPIDGKTVTYKLLINDLSWSVGPDYVTESGVKVTVEPTF